MIDSFKNLINLVEHYDEDEQFDIADLPDSNTPTHSHNPKGGESYDLGEVSIDQLIRLIEDDYEDKRALLIYGASGIGKSDIVASSGHILAKKLGDNRQVIDWSNIPIAERKQILKSGNYKKYFPIWDIRTSNMEPSDITGMMDITSKEAWIEMKPQEYAYYMSQPDSAGILFLDEINQGHQQVQKALFEVILKRTVSGLHMNDNWGIVAAGNLGSALYGNESIPPALTSRMDVCVLVADAPSWLKWARANNINEYICSFVESNPEDNFYGEVTQDNQYPCPRSFAALSKTMYTVWKKAMVRKKMGILNYDPVTELNIRANSACGPKWAARFMAFLRFSRHFNWEEMFKNPKKFFTLNKNKTNTSNADTVDVDVLHGELLYLTKQSEIRLGEVVAGAKKQMESPKYDKQKTVFELATMLSHLDEEWTTTFLTKLNTVSKNVSIEFIAGIINNREKEPYKSFYNKHCKTMIAMNKKQDI
jgi:hypothetical protein